MRVTCRSCPSETGEPVYEQTAPIKPCCAEMARRWGSLVCFGIAGARRSTSREVNLYVPQPQANGKAVLEVVPVAFCPWCGEAVKTYRMK